ICNPLHNHSAIAPAVLHVRRIPPNPKFYNNLLEEAAAGVPCVRGRSGRVGAGRQDWHGWRGGTGHGARGTRGTGGPASAGGRARARPAGANRPGGGFGATVPTPVQPPDTLP